MPIYRVNAGRLGAVQVRAWRERLARTLGLLLANLVLCAIGLLLLDSSGGRLGDKAFNAVWNATNLISTIGDFQGLNTGQRVFMVGTMLAFVMIGGFAVSRLSGILSSVPAISYRENRHMQGQFDKLANHVVVIGFGPLGQLVAGRLRDLGDSVLVIDRVAELAARASERGFLAIEADAGEDDDVLARVAGLGRAKALVITTEDPDRKLSLTLNAHALNPNIKIIVTGANSQRGAMLSRAGAAEVVIAEELIADALVARLAKQGRT